MSLKEFLLLMTAVVTSSLGQLLLKLGATKLSATSDVRVMSKIFQIATIPELILGLTCYGLGAIAYIFLLTTVNLSIAAPSASLIYVVTIMLSQFVLGETVRSVTYLGLGFIILGVVLVASR
jgi:drug/metabolite transporter (DMT)-like permease